MYLIVFVILLLAACVPAFIFGDIPERVAACSFPVALALSVWATPDDATDWGRFRIDLFAIDAALLGTMLYITVKYDRWWTLFATAGLVISMLAHLAKLRQLPLSSGTYAAMEGLPSLLTLIALAFGTLEYRARQRAGRSGRR